MKILVAYDGSRSADMAVDDLTRSGLPFEGVEALVISVAEVWMPPPQNGGPPPDEYPESIVRQTDKMIAVAKSALNEADTMSRHARERILTRFPNWKVTAESTNGSPGWEILACAKNYKPDLIIVGSKGRNALGRILQGSVSQKIMTEAECSVRVVHESAVDFDTPIKIMIAFDGSPGSNHAVKAVAARAWRKDSEVCLMTAVHSLLPATIGRFVSPKPDQESGSDSDWVHDLTKSSRKLLEKSGLTVTTRTLEGSPKEIIVAEARKWHADSIFVGAHSYSGTLERLLIGSTAAAITSRAICSVEAVRPSPVY